jgi:hypothetical protein
MLQTGLILCISNAVFCSAAFYFYIFILGELSILPVVMFRVQGVLLRLPRRMSLGLVVSVGTEFFYWTIQIIVQLLLCKCPQSEQDVVLSHIAVNNLWFLGLYVINLIIFMFYKVRRSLSVFHNAEALCFFEVVTVHILKKRNHVVNNGIGGNTYC